MTAVAPVVDPAKVEAPVAPVVGTPEYDAAMAAKYDASQGVSAEAPVRPEHVPEKFWNAETGVIDTAAWAKSYTELEQKQSGVKPADAPVIPPVDAQKTPEEIAAAEALESRGISMEALSAEFQQAGALSEKSYADLAAKGIPKAMVDQYIAGQQAMANQVTAEAHAVAGGKDEFAQMVKWAATGLTAGEIAAYDAAVTGGTLDQMKFAVAGLKARYEAINGKEPGLLGGGNANAGGNGFASLAEQTAAIKDPRYQKDPAYRAQVATKIGNSTF